MPFQELPRGAPHHTIMHTPRIASLGHVGIFVEDVERSLAFYRDLLGLFDPALLRN